MKSPALCPQFSPADLSRVEAARGFLELGLPDAAWEELEQVVAAARAAAAVLALRVQVYLAKGMVGEARVVETGAIRMHPEAGGCHYALGRWLRSLPETFQPRRNRWRWRSMRPGIYERPRSMTTGWRTFGVE